MCLCVSVVVKKTVHVLAHACLSCLCGCDLLHMLSSAYSSFHASCDLQFITSNSAGVGGAGG